MTKPLAWIAATALFTGVSLLPSLSPAQPAGDLRKTVREVASLFRKADKDKGDLKAAKELAAKTARGITETTELMAMFRLRDKGGIGIGPVAGPNPAKDGIEATIRELARNVPPAALKDTAALEETGYIIAAMGEIVHAKGWPKDEGQKTKKAWHEYSEDARVTGLAFARAAATKNPATIKLAALKVNIACGGCHAFFK